jgi:3-deoxy-D-manno-octulosonate 8-phosphate phosphatase (KDO 8-P phosphatase)
VSAMIGALLGADGDAPKPVAIDPAVARRIRWVGFDVDGVLTDGGIFLGDVAGERLEFKRYDIQDGLGILMLRMAGIGVGIVTGRVSESVRLRAAELGADDLVQDPHARKLPALRDIARRRGIARSEMAFVGDDLPDVGPMRAVGLPVSVHNATPEAWRAARVRLTADGGRGAVREFSELLLRARGEWDDLVERYVSSRDTTGEAPVLIPAGAREASG